VGGCETTDEAVLKIVALEAQRYAGSVVKSALDKRFTKQAGTDDKTKPKLKSKLRKAAAGTSQDDKVVVLTAEDLQATLCQDESEKALRAPYFVKM
jgi:hypothetical protein